MQLAQSGCFQCRKMVIKAARFKAMSVFVPMLFRFTRFSSSGQQITLIKHPQKRPVKCGEQLTIFCVF